MLNGMRFVIDPVRAYLELHYGRTIWGDPLSATFCTICRANPCINARHGIASYQRPYDWEHDGC